jgi:phosphoribosylformimino-5-aminoimidazole carboxamide ribotide isomerase
MILYPAIDLKDGACVRLKQGDMARATVFSTDPGSQARAFAKDGFERLHVVDLNGAFAGRSVNGAAVEAILAAVDLPVQLGGGVRDMAAIEAWLNKGVARVILGTAAVREPELVRGAARAFPGRIAVGIDARAGKVAVSGWGETTEIDAIDLARRFEDAGIAAIIHTDIARDGLLKGLNIAATLKLARAVAIPVIASGGLASLADVERLLQLDCAILEGAIAGRALYDGRLDGKAALALIRAAREAA